MSFLGLGEKNRSDGKKSVTDSCDSYFSIYNEKCLLCNANDGKAKDYK